MGRVQFLSPSRTLWGVFSVVHCIGVNPMDGSLPEWPQANLVGLLCHDQLRLQDKRFDLDPEPVWAQI